MIEIYLKTNTDYSNNGDMTLTPAACTYKDSENLVTLEHPLDELGRWKYIDFENVIAADVNGKKKLYRIYNVVKSLYSVTAYARPLFFDLIDNVLLDVRPTNKTAQEALNIVLEGTGFTGHSNITTVNTSYYARKNIVEAILGDDENSFLNRWGGEYYFDNFDIYINDKIGSDNGVRVEFGYNLNEIEEDINIEEVATRIIPVGFDGITLEGNTPWVDSQLISKYTKPKMRVINFDDVKVKETETDEEGFDTLAEAQAELIKRCNKLYEEGIDKPTVNYKIDMINLANTTAYKDFKMLVDVKKGDTIICYIKNLDIDVKARVIDYEKDLLTGEYISIELGNAQSNFFNQQADIQSRVDNIINSNGAVKGESIEGIINALNTQFKAMRDVAQKQHVRAMIFEDLDPESPSFGAMCIGTMGFQISRRRTADNRDWEWSTFGTGQGFFADLIVAGKILGANLEINLDTGEVMFSKGLISGKNLSINLDTGVVQFNKGSISGKNITMNLDTGIIKSSFNQAGELRDLTIQDGEINSDYRLGLIAKQYLHFSQKKDGILGSSISIDDKNIIIAPSSYQQNGEGRLTLGSVFGWTEIFGSRVEIGRVGKELILKGNVTVNGSPIAAQIAQLENLELQREGLI